MPETGEPEAASEDWGNEKLGSICAMSAGPAGKVIIAYTKGRIEAYSTFGRLEESIAKRVPPQTDWLIFARIVPHMLQ